MSTEREIGRLSGAVEALTDEVRTSRRETRSDMKEIHKRISQHQARVAGLEKQITDHKGEHRGKKIALVGMAGVFGAGFVKALEYFRSHGGGS